MVTERWIQQVRLLAGLAGLTDLATGLALLVQPHLTLALMGVSASPDGAAVMVRFVGAFVAAVGATYLAGARTREVVLLRGLLLVTLIFRAAAGGFTAVALARGWLEPAWASVPLVDLTLVTVQLIYWARSPHTPTSHA